VAGTSVSFTGAVKYMAEVQRQSVLALLLIAPRACIARPRLTRLHGGGVRRERAEVRLGRVERGLDRRGGNGHPPPALRQQGDADNHNGDIVKKETCARTSKSKTSGHDRRQRVAEFIEGRCHADALGCVPTFRLGAAQL
jgi:hypothetical protein